MTVVSYGAIDVLKAQTSAWPCAVVTRTGGTAQAVASAELTVTSFHRSPVGGGILFGRDGAGHLFRALVPAAVAAREPAPGEPWRLTGQPEMHPVHGSQLHAGVALPLLPTGAAIIRLLATNRRFPGVGFATAKRLWTMFGERLYEILESGDPEPLTVAVSPEQAVSIADGFGLMTDEVNLFRWFDRYGIAPRTAAGAAALWGAGATLRISADPYALSLLEPWADVDVRALRLGLALDDERRLLAAAEEAFSRRYKRGNTAATRDEIRSQIRGILGVHSGHLADRALKAASAAGRIIERPGGLLQSRACHVMEMEVARLLAKRMAGLAERVPDGSVRAAIVAIERDLDAPLSARQREAVWMAVSTPVSLLLGGPGTGKTATLKAVTTAIIGTHGLGVIQAAVAGRAAKRITAATGLPAWTLAGLLRRLTLGKGIPGRGLLVIDEGSMLDLPALYRTLTLLPVTVNVLLVGDPGQLIPIGPGLPFHKLAASDSVPKVELDIVHRQKQETGIPAVAAAIRRGCLPELPILNMADRKPAGVYLFPAPAGQIKQATLRVFRMLAGAPPMPGRTDTMHQRDVQVLAAVKNGDDGIKAINEAIEAEWMRRQPAVRDWGLSVGSKVMWLRNDYTKAPLRDEDGPLIDPVTGEPVCAGFYNGSLGIIREKTEGGARVEFDDGAADEIRTPDLANLTRGWATSIHKAQGSGFRTVIVPVTTSRLLDRTLLYTAITRAIETCVLVGELAVIKAAVEALPRAVLRRECLDIDGAVAALKALQEAA